MLEDEKGRLPADRAALAAEPAPRLSDEDAENLEAFAAEIRQGAAHATVAERRLIYQMLQLVGTVRRDDEHGRKLKLQNRFSMEWSNALTLRRMDGSITNIQTVWIGPAEISAGAKEKAVASVE